MSSTGNKLFQQREKRKMSQAEFAELLGMSQSAYSRLEKGETKLDFDQIKHIAKALGIPAHELLPEWISFNNNHHQGQGGVIFGDYIYNANPVENELLLKNEVELLKQKVAFLEEKNSLLENQLKTLQSLLKDTKKLDV
jgi:transcriptional regulator with XRE-family HTH domain